jgi:predicted DNA-binding transcriptional regulator YafY
VGQRSATETLFGIVHLFIEQRTWIQAELARRLELGVPALRKRLVELQAAGWPFERSDEDVMQVYWSVPRDWLPGALHFKETEAVELLRQIGRLPQCAARKALLEAVVTRLPQGARSATFDASAVVSSALTDAEERFVPAVEDAATGKVTMAFRYFTVSRREEDWRRASVHRLELGPPARFIATCHRSSTLKWFRVDNVLDARPDANEAYREVSAETLATFEAESLDGFHEDRAPVTCSFVVRNPEGAWVRRNLLKGMKAEALPDGVRVSVHTTAVQRVARLVVSLGDTARPENPELRDAVIALAKGALAAAQSSQGSSID